MYTHAGRRYNATVESDTRHARANIYTKVRTSAVRLSVVCPSVYLSYLCTCPSVCMSDY